MDSRSDATLSSRCSVLVMPLVAVLLAGCGVQMVRPGMAYHFENPILNEQWVGAYGDPPPPPAVRPEPVREARIESAPAALNPGAPIRVLDISDEPSTHYVDARQRLGPNDVVGKFNAINRKGTTVDPIVPELERFARGRGADAAVISCGQREVDGKQALVCAGILVRTR